MSFPLLDSFAQSNLGTVFRLEDSQFFSDTPVDPAVRKETDGGLVFTRPQYTRAPSRLIVTGFSALPHAYKQILDFFWINTAKGGAVAFDYIHPLDNVTLSVRFEEPWTSLYKGIGADKVWDITNIKMRTV